MPPGFCAEVCAKAGVNGAATNATPRAAAANIEVIAVPRGESPLAR
jgi:hypothetical protein